MVLIPINENPPSLLDSCFADVYIHIECVVPIDQATINGFPFLLHRLVYLKRSKSERVRPRVTTATKDESVGDLGVADAIEHISPRPHHRRLSMGHHPHAHHATPQRLTVEPESGNFGLSTSDLSLDSNSSCNPSYKYGNQVRGRPSRRQVVIGFPSAR